MENMLFSVRLLKLTFLFIKKVGEAGVGGSKSTKTDVLN